MQNKNLSCNLFSFMYTISLLLILGTYTSYAKIAFNEKELLKLLSLNSSQPQEMPNANDLWQNNIILNNVLTSSYGSQLAFSPTLYGNISYEETKELPLISFQPVFSPTRFMTLGVKQFTPFGLSWDLYGATTIQDADKTGSSSGFKNATVSVIGINLELDLWRDFLGSGTGNLYKEAELQKQNALLIKNNMDKKFLHSLRQIYWSIVATNESIELMESLITIAEKQLQESLRRRKNSLADADEVSRYEAQLQGRKSELYFKLFQKEKLLQELRRRASSLHDQEIDFAKENIQATQLEVMSCIKQISEIQEIPYSNTNVDEQIQILAEIKDLQSSRLAKQHGLDLKLFGGVRSTGVDSRLIATNSYQGSQSEAWNDLYQNDRWGTEVGIKFTMPLDSTSSKLEESQTRAATLSTELQIKEHQENLKIYHQQFKKMITFLEAGIESQTAQTKSLKNIISLMNIKYRQARVSLTDLLQNQDAHYQAELRTIDARLEILNYLLDYLKLFPDTNCAFNR